MILISYYILILFTTCSSYYYVPAKSKELNQFQYENYKRHLISAHENGNNFDIAIQLANLHGKNGIIFRHLNKSISKNIVNCQNLFQMQYLADQNFFQNLYKSDTALFKHSFQLCLQKLGLRAYDEYVMNEKILETQLDASKTKIDSLMIKVDLIKALQAIRDFDQKYRIKLANFSLLDSEKKDLWSKQLVLDSINLKKVDSILENNQFPSPYEVGYDLSQVIFLVLHHQINIEIREKYFVKIKKNISEEQSLLFKNRTKDLRNNEH